MHSRDDVVEFSSLPEIDPDGAVTRKASSAGEDEIAHAGQSGERLLARSTGNGETRDFGQPPGNQRRHGIVAEPESVANTGRDGDYVFERAAKFDPDDVVVGVDAEGMIAKFALYGGGQLSVFAADGNGRRIAAGDFLGK